MHKKRGLDCMHWSWINYPPSGLGRKEDSPTIVLEAVASQDLWFWHVFFVIPGSHNDINIIDRSHLFSPLANMQAPQCRFEINGNWNLSMLGNADSNYFGTERSKAKKFC
ncbi:LOW QUALITY PROTEIN: Transposon protein, Pong sub-class [Phytophthora palmivora]|uniref:Transposon protein, Pong sub-class n=1 Tax=Phytophthora palmivora TaxID=4796 RepID=A0A2P4XJ99_9STRA|nr:LOW QUALITY PROTEIN: Transposon protein, Pong sub-class [Phytophthora palmivora]